MAAQEIRIFRYQVDFGGGEREVVSLLEPEWVFQRGLHPEAIMGVVRTGADAEDLKPEDVRENGSFLRLLSRVIFENVADCGGIRRQAVIQGHGHVYLLDGRTPDPGGRVPLEDIMGSVEVDDGAPVAGSYQHNPKHRLFTAAGWFRLPGELEAALHHRLRTRTVD